MRRDMVFDWVSFDMIKGVGKGKEKKERAKQLW